LVTDVQKRVDKIDAIDLFSNIMSSATDNAKELLLAKLNAVGENIDLYTFLFATGYNFDEAANIMMSDTFNLVAKYGSQNIFVNGSNRINQDSVLKFLKGRAHLPIVNQNVIHSIFRELEKNKDYVGTGSVSKENSFLSYLLINDNDSFVEFKKLLETKDPNVSDMSVIGILQYISTNTSIREFLESEIKDSEFTVLENFLLSRLNFETAYDLLVGNDG
jgi:hypothetical protein